MMLPKFTFKRFPKEQAFAVTQVLFDLKLRYEIRNLQTLYLGLDDHIVVGLEEENWARFEKALRNES